MKRVPCASAHDSADVIALLSDGVAHDQEAHDHR
jgi:hypothetical protein